MNEWISVKERLPPFDIFVEVIYHQKSRMNVLKRDFASLVKENGEVFWSKESCDERDYGKYGVIYWKPMTPDHLGRTPKNIKMKKKGCLGIRFYRDIGNLYK